MELFSSKLKNLLIFQEGTCKPENQKNIYFFPNIIAKEKSFI